MGRDGGGFAQYLLFSVLSCKVERAKHMFGKLGTQRLMCRNIGWRGKPWTNVRSDGAAAGGEGFFCPIQGRRAHAILLLLPSVHFPHIRQKRRRKPLLDVYFFLGNVGLPPASSSNAVGKVRNSGHESPLTFPNKSVSGREGEIVALYFNFPFSVLLYGWGMVVVVGGGKGRRKKCSQFSVTCFFLDGRVSWKRKPTIVGIQK